MADVNYQRTFFEQKSLREAAREFLKHLPSDVDVLLSQGSSGCTIATAMMLASRRTLTHVYVRKEYEMKGHGTQFVGWDYILADHKFAIVDDFISNGRTIRRILKLAKATGISVTLGIVGNNPGFNPPDVIEKLSIPITIVY